MAYRRPRRAALAAGFALLLAAAAASAADKTKGTPQPKPEKGASCKAPAVGTCAACSITCRAGETATCRAGVVVGDACHTQPACGCKR